jgi:hypothetical protein
MITFPVATVITLLDHTGMMPRNASTSASTSIAPRAAARSARACTQAVTAGGMLLVGAAGRIANLAEVRTGRGTSAIRRMPAALCLTVR